MGFMTILYIYRNLTIDRRSHYSLEQVEIEGFSNNKQWHYIHYMRLRLYRRSRSFVSTQIPLYMFDETKNVYVCMYIDRTRRG